MQHIRAKRDVADRGAAKAAEERREMDNGGRKEGNRNGEGQERRKERGISQGYPGL